MTDSATRDPNIFLLSCSRRGKVNLGSLSEEDIEETRFDVRKTNNGYTVVVVSQRLRR